MADVNQYQPKPEDVEAAVHAYAMEFWHHADLDTKATGVDASILAAIAALRARGWRDAAEHQSTLRAVHAANQERAECAAQRDAALSREHALVCDLESTIAEWKEMGEEKVTAENAASVIAADIARSADVSRNDASHYLAALRKLAAERDAARAEVEAMRKEGDRLTGFVAACRDAAYDDADSFDDLAAAAAADPEFCAEFVADRVKRLRADRDALAKRLAEAEAKLEHERSERERYERNFATMVTHYADADKRAAALAEALANACDEWDALIAHRITVDLGLASKDDPAWRRLDLKRWANVVDAMMAARTALAANAAGTEGDDAPHPVTSLSRKDAGTRVVNVVTGKSHEWDGTAWRPLPTPPTADEKE